MESYGWIVERKTLAPVFADVKFYNSKTGVVYSQFNSDHFHVFTNLDPNNAVNDDDVILEIKAQGFKTYKATASNLLPQNDVYLEKSSLPILQLAAASALLAIGSGKKKKVSGVTVDDVKPFLLIGGGLLAFDTVRRILQGIGFWDSKDTKEIDALSKDPNSFWSPQFYLNLLNQGVTWSTGINTSTADQWLAELNNSFHFYGDDEARAKGILKRCQTQATLSFLAWEFNYKTGADFLAWLRGQSSFYPWAGLSDSDINEVSQYISKLPKY